MTFASTINMILLAGAEPVFVDCDYGTLNLNPALIEERISPRTKAIIPVHFAGAPADMDPILALARRHSLAVIEDAAHAVGTRYKEVHVGGFGVPAIFSFHPIKNITTGEGGMVTLDDESLEKTLRLLRFHGIERDAWKRYGKGGNPEYDVATPGFKYNLTDMQAALGLAQLDRLEAFNLRRRELVGLYREGLQGVDGLDLPKYRLIPTNTPGICLSSRCGPFPGSFYGAPRGLPDWLRSSFSRSPSHGVRPLAFGKRGVPLAETERAAGRICSLPLFPDMKDDDVAYVCEAVREILS
jgi:dTDP-4-amino-4,6-dideoxygalactose transaminase